MDKAKGDTGQGQGRHDDEGRRQGFSAIKASTMWHDGGGGGDDDDDDDDDWASRGCATSR